MQTVAGMQAFRAAHSEATPVVAIGTFDGVHRGHRALLDLTRARAHALGVPAAVYTFDPHPTAVVAPAAAPAMLVGPRRKQALIAEAGIDVCVIEPFTRALAELSPSAFVVEALVTCLRAREVVVGWDWTYGQRRAGTAASLVDEGIRHGFAVHVVPALTDADGAVSSTRIRASLRAGEVARARTLLGRRFDVGGTVVHGAKRGRELGFPTANVRPDVPIPVALGIYAGWLVVDGVRLAAVASLGTNPTFVDAGPVSLEVFVLDWQGDLYDRLVRFEFTARLRGEARFDGVPALVAQMHADVAAARACLADDHA